MDTNKPEVDWKKIDRDVDEMYAAFDDMTPEEQIKMRHVMDKMEDWMEKAEKLLMVLENE